MHNITEIEEKLKSITDLSYDRVKSMLKDILGYSNVSVSEKEAESFFFNAVEIAIEVITSCDSNVMVDFLVSQFAVCIYRFENKKDIEKHFVYFLVMAIVFNQDVIFEFIEYLETQLKHSKYTKPKNKRSLGLIENWIFLLKEIRLKKVRTNEKI